MTTATRGGAQVAEKSTLPTGDIPDLDDLKTPKRREIMIISEGTDHQHFVDLLGKRGAFVPMGPMLNGKGEPLSIKKRQLQKDSEPILTPDDQDSSTPTK